MKLDCEPPNVNPFFNPSSSTVNKNQQLLLKPKLHQQLKPSLSKTLKQQIDQLSRHQWISEAAYFNAKARGFAPGHEASDWLAAEQAYIEMVIELFSSVFKEDAAITITGLQQLAKAIGAPEPEKINSKIELIHLIQATSHHPPCFRTNLDEHCQDKDKCQWKADCQKLVAEWWR